MEHPDKLVKIAEGREAEMFALDDERVLRLYRSGVPEAWITRSIYATEAAQAAGVRVPSIYGREEVDGRPGLIMERIPGTDLMNEISRKPWRVRAIGALCGRLHAQLNQSPAPADLESNHARFRRIIGGTPSISERYKEAAFKALDSLPEGDRLCHGDFHPANVMMKDGEPIIIDWSNVARSVPEADYVRSTIIYKMGSLPPGMPLIIRVGSVFARRVLTGAYFKAYRGVYEPDPALVKGWRLPVAVARIADSIEEEIPALSAYIDGILAEGDTPRG